MFIAFAGGFIVFGSMRFRQPKSVSQPDTIPQTYAEVVPKPKTTEILAPDGKQTLIVKAVMEKDGINETFSISMNDGTPPTEIYQKKLTEGDVISVPANTFSPDDKYIFLKEDNSGSLSYFVLRTDGKDMTTNSHITEFLSLFYQKYPDSFKVTDVTGWGGMTLIVVNTNNADGSIGPSFWYNVATRSFIRLNDRFN